MASACILAQIHPNIRPDTLSSAPKLCSAPTKHSSLIRSGQCRECDAHKRDDLRTRPSTRTLQFVPARSAKISKLKPKLGSASHSRPIASSALSANIDFAPPMQSSHAVPSAVQCGERSLRQAVHPSSCPAGHVKKRDAFLLVRVSA